jgi:hypothetical protein
MPKRRRALVALGVGASLVLVYVALWLQVDPLHVGRSDFTATYMGATLLREGHGPSMYDEQLQAPLHDRLIAPDHEGNLPFVNPPLAAAVALPLSLLDLHTAYRLWGLTQLLLLVAAAAVAIRAAPGGHSARWDERAAIAVSALACLGTATVVILGQWDGVSALGLALAYAAMRRHQLARAGAILAVTSLIAKPHLALGLAAFLIGWRERRLLLGALAGVAAAVAASVLVAGTQGVGGFVGAAFHSTTRWELKNMVSLVGLAGTFAGDTTTAHLLAAAGSVIALALAVMLGASMRRPSTRLEPALAGATVLSLLAALHAYPQDLSLLVPVAAWSFSAAAARWPEGDRVRTAVVALWITINVAACIDILSRAAVPPGQLTPWALIAAAALAAALTLRGQASPHGAASAGAPALLRR